MKITVRCYEQLISLFRILDSSTFAKSFPIYTVDCLPNEEDDKNSNIACFTEVISKNKKVKEVGGYYQVAMNIRGGLKKFSDKDIMGIVVHEVRHRFQAENPDCLIREDFLLARNNTASTLADNLRKMYLTKSKEYYEHEFDAYVIQQIFLQYSEGNRAFKCLSDVVEIVKCNPQIYDSLIIRLQESLHNNCRKWDSKGTYKKD